MAVLTASNYVNMRSISFPINPDFIVTETLGTVQTDTLTVEVSDYSREPIVEGKDIYGGSFEYTVTTPPRSVTDLSGRVTSYSTDRIEEWTDTFESFKVEFEISGFDLDLDIFLNQPSLDVVRTIFSGDDQISGGGTLLGFTGDDTITGGARADIIDGGEGKDTMAGGAGNDKYYVDNARDVIHELSDEGIDRVQSEVSYKLPDNVENLFLSGSTAINGTGNDGSNGLYGNSAANQLNGRAGADLMIGRGGDDVYIVEDTGDIVKEQASEGIDLVYALVSYTLTDDVENLVLKTANSLNGNGNALDNEISGNAGANILSGWRGSDTLKGAAGNDTLIGGLGADKLYGGSGADTFLFQSHKQSDMLERDIIYDFSHAQGDKIDLSAIDASVSVSGNQVFAFIGANAFSNKAGELRAIIKNGETFIHGDMNGDSTIDFSVKLATAVNLTSSDFIL